MAIGVEWGQSQRMAWGYVRAGVDSDLSATGALREYRSGGGAIRTQDWYDLWNKAEAAGDAWDKVSYLTPSDSVPESMFEMTDIKFEQKYVMNVNLTGITVQGETITEMYRYVESDERLTKQEWFAKVDQFLQKYAGVRDFKVYHVTDVAFYTRGD
jgi:hypothetical protein